MFIIYAVLDKIPTMVGEQVTLEQRNCLVMANERYLVATASHANNCWCLAAEVPTGATIPHRKTNRRVH